MDEVKEPVKDSNPVKEVAGVKFNTTTKVIAGLIVILLIAAAAGTYFNWFTEEVEEQKYNIVNVDNQRYEFINDIRDVINNVDLRGESGIVNLLAEAGNITIVFEDSEDNQAIAVGSYNIVFKHTQFRLWQLKKVEFHTELLNATNWTYPSIWIKGPNSGANETSVSLDDDRVVVQGLDANSTIMATERLSLLLLGIAEFEVV